MELTGGTVNEIKPVYFPTSDSVAVRRATGLTQIQEISESRLHCAGERNDQLRGKSFSPSRSSGDATNDAADATRELLLLTAERLLRGARIESVPLRDIGLAAGQRNNGVVQYHFGDRESLVRAIAGYRSRSLEEMSATSSRTSCPAAALRKWRTSSGRSSRRWPRTSKATATSYRSVHAALSNGAASPAWTTLSPSGLTTTLRSIMRRLLPDHSDALLYERWQVLMTSAVHTLARYQVAMQHSRLPAPIDDLIDDLVRFLTSGLEAPVR